MAIELHDAGRDHARQLIDAHQYVKDSDWSSAQPTTEEENAFIEAHGYEAYGRWHLAVDEEHGAETKARYAFVVGDFRRVHRSGLIAAKQRAAEWDHDTVLDAADSLLADVPAE